MALSTINQTNKQTELYATSYSQDITFVIPKEEYPFMTLHVFFFILYIVLLFILFFSPYYWSDMFTVLVNMSTSMQICDDWNKNDMTIQTMHHDNVTSCPCSLDVALLDLAGFILILYVQKLQLMSMIATNNHLLNSASSKIYHREYLNLIQENRSHIQYIRVAISLIYVCGLAFYAHVENTA